MNKWLRQDLWRHLVGTTICLFALFPLYLVIISSFSSSGSLQLSSFIPREISFANYSKLFNDPTIPYLTWVKNSLRRAPLGNDWYGIGICIQSP